MNFQFFRPYFSLVLMVALVGVWWVFAPMQVGGGASYLIINGNSMEPLYRRNDLVIVRRAMTPRVGDIFAYRQPDLGVVIHRILARQGDSYIFQGDNNAWADAYHPHADELIGKAWVHIPGAGKWLLALRQPWALALLFSLIGGYVMFTFFHQDKKRKPAARAMPAPGSRRELALFLLPVIFLGFAILSFFAFRMPVNRLSSSELAFSHLTLFDYSAPARADLFTNGQMSAPQPIFTRLACRAQVTLSYAFAAVLPVSARGSYRVVALLSEPSGWSREIELVPETPFEGQNVSARFPLDICKMQALGDEFVRATGISRAVFELAVLTPIQIHGEMAGFPLEEAITPTLRFQLDSLQLALQSQPSGVDPLSVKQDGMIALSGQAANQVTVLGRSLSVFWLRFAGLAGMLTSLALLIWLGIPFYRAMRQNPIQAIRARYETSLVRVTSLPILETMPNIAVANLDDLARLAQASAAPVLEYHDGHLTRYIVIHHNCAFCYHLPSNPETAP